jgi:hypothetical protein
MELTPEEITQLSFIRLALSEFIEKLESRGGLKGNRLVFFVKEGWEADIINISSMEQVWFENHQNEHGEDERKSSQGE